MIMIMINRQRRTIKFTLYRGSLFIKTIINENLNDKLWPKNTLKKYNYKVQISCKTKQKKTNLPNRVSVWVKLKEKKSILYNVMSILQNKEEKNDKMFDAANISYTK